jgi:hypothetical protein
MNRLQQAAHVISPELVDARMEIHVDAGRLRRMVAFSNSPLEFDRILFLAGDCPAHHTRAHHQFYGGERTGDGALPKHQVTVTDKNPPAFLAAPLMRVGVGSVLWVHHATKRNGSVRGDRGGLP